MARNSKNLRSINNETAYAIVNAAYKQAVGDAAVATLDLSNFVDSGVAYESLTLNRDRFYNALLDQVVNFYNDESYESEYNDPFYVDEARFGSVVALINSIANDVEENAAWKNFRPDTSTNPPTYATVGTYTIKPNEVKVNYAQKQVAWQLPLWLTEEQENTAFKSENEIRRFIDYLYVVTENKLLKHREDLSRANIASLIAHKFLADQNGTPGIHVVNLLAKYNKERGKSISSVEAFLADPDALRYASSQIILYSEYLRAQTSLFNTEGLVKFCPENRLILEINSAFRNCVESVALSTTFHDSYVELNGISVPAWQGFGITSVSDGTEAASFDEVTSINVTIDKESSVTNTNATINKSGIVAVLADQHAAIHTIKNVRVASQYFDIEHLRLLAYQNVDMFINNLSQNAVVFTLEAPVVPPVSEVRMNMKK